MGMVLFRNCILFCGLLGVNCRRVWTTGCELQQGVECQGVITFNPGIDPGILENKGIDPGIGRRGL